jgi:hypothetical protein
MYGLIGQMLAAPGKRDDLLAILRRERRWHARLPQLRDRQGRGQCRRPVDHRGLDRQGRPRRSLKLPAVQAAIAKARPIIAGFPQHFETIPVGGHGLKA